jgi:YYY domain-containing protein
MRGCGAKPVPRRFAADDYKLFSVRNILAWILAVEILGLAVLPALRAFFGNRRDAALLSRPIGLALTGWLAWAVAVATPLGFTRAGILLSVLLLAGISFFGMRREGPAARPFWGAEENRGALFFWVPAAVFLVVRAAAPEILGAEKFMDLAFFNSLTRFPDMPPLDPWMSGRTINYYYWGYLLVATVAKGAAVSPFVAYNLALASFAGFSFAAAAGLGFRLSSGRTGAALGAGFASVFAGNLAGAFDAWAHPFAKDFDYWHASRVIGKGDTINEFPFFTFFHADLHPHLLAFPFFIAAFAVADRWVEAGAASPEDAEKGAGAWLRRATPLLLVALVAATAVAANLWNAPAIAFLLVFAGAARTTRGERLPGVTTAGFGALTGFGVFVIAMFLTQPYRSSYRLPYNGLGKAHAASGLFEFFGVWGILFGVAAAGFLGEIVEETEAGRRKRDLLLALGGAAAILVAFLRKAPALAPLVFLAVLALRAAWRSLSRGDDRKGLFAAFLCLLALGMIAGCELVYFKDNYGDQLHRMNTIFKFYHQAWPLLGIGAVVFADRAWQASAKRRRRMLATVLAVAAFAAALYPATAIASRLKQRTGSFTLDARSALDRRNRADLEAIEWLRRNALAGSVVMEAAGDPYTEFARISSHTGIPSVLGWANHEGLWRSNDPDVMKRLADVKTFYTATDPRTAEEILRRYRVTHVVVGDLERRTYGGAPRVPNFPFVRPVRGAPDGIFQVSR